MATNAWGLDHRYFSEKLGLIARDAESYTPDEMMRALIGLGSTAAAQGKVEPHITCSDRCERFEDALLWVLYHHQGGNSKTGQPIRKLLGIGQFKNLSYIQVKRAQRFSDGAG